MELYELNDDILAISSMEVEGCCGLEVSIAAGGGGGAFDFFRRVRLSGRLGVLVAIDDLYIELEKGQVI